MSNFFYVHCTSSNYILSLLNFIPINQAKGALSWLVWIEYSQPDDLLDKIGIESGSTYINNISLFLFLVWIIPVHLFLIFLSKKIKLNENSGNWSKWLSFLTNFLMRVLTFAYYVRTISESYQYLCLSSFSELVYFSQSTTSLRISLSIAFIVSLFIVTFFGFVCWLAFSSKAEASVSEKYFSHYYDELKDGRQNTIFLVFLIFRRMLLTIVVINL